MAENVIYKLSKTYALRIVKVYNYLTKSKGEFVMSKQLYRSGTSVGANIAESLYAQSDADYVSKLKISLKEASETKYWLELLYESEYLSKPEFDSLVNDINTIVGTLVNIINKVQNK
ncbi:MAG: four helix bundle protein [Prevotella sp.]|nr:four helix bundle protein [Prevotella sp.]